MNIFLKAPLITLAIMVGALAVSNYAAHASESLAAASNSVLKFQDQDRPICSSVAVSKTQIVTAAHCVEGKDLSILLPTMNEKQEVVSKITLPVEKVRVFKDEDVAFLELKDKTYSLDPIDICTSVSLKLGDPLWAIGYPKVQELTLTEGMYTGLTSLKDGLDMDSLFYKTTIPITGGNSGGALIAMKGSPDWGYCLAGLATASYRDVSFMSYFSTNENLQKVVKNLLNKEGKTTTKSETPAPAPSGNRIDSK